MDRDHLMKLGAPTVPPETCPRCDFLSVHLDCIAGDLQTFREGMDYSPRKTVDKDEVREALEQAEEGLATARLEVEALRIANEQLRESGRYWRKAHRALSESLAPA